jgi:hypothetical protein
VSWFNRASPPPVAPEVLKPYITGKHFISTKQAPSALTLRKSGSNSVWRERETLLKAGAPLERVIDDRSQQDFTIDISTSGANYSDCADSSIADQLRRARLATDSRSPSGSDGDESDSEGTPSDEPEALDKVEAIDPEGKTYLRIKYEDPWKIFAALVWCESTGKTRPNIISWNGDGSRIQDGVHPSMFGPVFAAGKRNKVRFSRVSDHEARCFYIRNHTHWGHALYEMCADEISEKRHFARTLKRRLHAFISGKSDPLMPNGTKDQIFVDWKSPRSTRARSERLIEMLKTVDGIFLSRYLSHPEEVWTWEKFDTFILGGIACLIGDEFLDGELTTTALDITTSYSLLKKSRKSFKQFAHERNLKEKLLSPNRLAEEAWIEAMLRPVWSYCARQTGTRYVFVTGILSQTRGAGTPPPLVILQSKRKFLATVSTVPSPPNQTQDRLVRQAIDEILNELPQSAFTGLATKGRVTVTGSATWENTRATGGTAETIREVLSQYNLDNLVPVRDLETGNILCYKHHESFDTVGEFIFWACLQEVLQLPPDELNYAFLTVVSEPGKGRSVTKGRACVKVILDVAAKICAWPLKKGIASSTSGMGQSHHAWNSFLDMMSEPMRSEVFALDQPKEDVEFGDYVERQEIYENYFQSSTDYEEATDRMKLWFARISGNAWMVKCGIPPILRGIVNAVCYRPRKIFFTGKGALAAYGEAAPEFGQDVRFVMLSQGVLMGDPLTKIVLHMSNIVTRRLGDRMGEPNFHRRATNPEQVVAAYVRGLKRRP